jgi:hypothetical protein
MKTLSILFLALLCGVAIHAQQRQAVGTTKVNTDFSSYKTFMWAQSDATVVGPEGYDIYYYEFEADDHRNHKAKDKQKADKTKVDRKAAKRVSESQPSYVYSYSVIIPAKDASANGVIQDAISGELEGRGYREASDNGDLLIAYQVLDQRASLHGYNNDEPAVASGQEVRQPSDTTTFALEPGTLIINLVDTKTSEVVWTGFSSGMNNNNTFITGEGELKEAIHNIFEEFKYTADKARKD